MKQQELVQKLRQDIQGLIETVEHSFMELPEPELNWKESNKQWSALECIEHLNRYNRYYNSAISKAIEKVPAGAAIEFISTWIGAKFIDMMRPENKKKQKTFNRMNPVGSKLSITVLQEFIKHQQELLALIDRAAGKDLKTGKVPVEFFKLLTFTVGDALQFVAVHEQRHMLQALRVIKTQTTNNSLVTF